MMLLNTRRVSTVERSGARTHARQSIPATAVLAAAAVFTTACSGAEKSEKSDKSVLAEPERQISRDKLAFPDAEGYGRFAIGGRGGKIIFVTTLADKGPGSLRACIDAKGPRTCVFRVSGVIRFLEERPVIKNPFLTIAGQTAPGEGILITHDGGAAGLTPILVKGTHDIVIRHIRVRTDKLGDNREANDAFTIEDSNNILLDHVSGSWARDENVNTHGANDAITISSSIFAEGLRRHDKCALLGSDARQAQNVSFIKNICAHNGDRSPEVNFPQGSCIEVINNVLYNASAAFLEIWESHGGTPVNVIGNYFRSGPESLPDAGAIVLQKINSTGSARIYRADNRVDPALIEINAAASAAEVAEPVCPPTHDALAVNEAYRKVMRTAGALPRDAFDRRVVSDVDNRKGELVSVPGELPVIAATEPDADDDRDGMEDAWESAGGARPGAYDPWSDADGDGWTNFDEFLDFAHLRLAAQAEAGKKD